MNVSRIVVTDVADPAVRAAIARGLAQANRVHVSEPNMLPLVALVDGGADGRLVGGLWGRTSWEWLRIELLYVSEESRGCGWGTKLIRAAEAEAIDRGCHSAWVDTYSFQAPSFYERQGYVIFGILDNYPTGQKRLFLQKTLSVTRTDHPSPRYTGARE